jgi:hypothetical protein
MLKGLPDDKCIAPRWGYMPKGKVTYPFADRSETYEGGEAIGAKRAPVRPRQKRDLARL